jgi:hypothetical protein
MNLGFNNRPSVPKREGRTDDYENVDSVRRSFEIKGGSDSSSIAEESDIHFVFADN